MIVRRQTECRPVERRRRDATLSRRTQSWTTSSGGCGSLYSLCEGEKQEPALPDSAAAHHVVWLRTYATTSSPASAAESHSCLPSALCTRYSLTFLNRQGEQRASDKPLHLTAPCHNAAMPSTSSTFPMQRSSIALLVAIFFLCGSPGNAPNSLQFY